MMGEPVTHYREKYLQGYSIGVGAVVVRDERALLVRRALGRGTGDWAIQSGFVNRDETIDVAVRAKADDGTRADRSLRRRGAGQSVPPGCDPCCSVPSVRSLPVVTGPQHAHADEKASSTLPISRLATADSASSVPTATCLAARRSRDGRQMGGGESWKGS